MNLICFKVGKTVYGIDMGSVLKLSQYESYELEVLPNSEPHIIGALEYEGVPICTYDVSVFFGEPLVHESKDVVVFLGTASSGCSLVCVAGIRITDLQGVENDVDEDAIRSIVGEHSGDNRAYLRGLVKTKNGEVVVICADKFVHYLKKH